MRHLTGLAIRLILLLLVVAIIGFFVIRSHYSSSDYREKITDQLKVALGAEEIKLIGFSRDSNSGQFRELKMVGGEGSFFYNAELEELNGGFSYLTGLTEDWNPGSIRIKKADFQIKGGGSEEEMASSFASLISGLDGEGVSLIKIESLSCDWGYSKLTYGAINGTNFKAVLKGGKWQIEIKGGTFQQNWFGPLQIEQGTLQVDGNGLEVVSLDLALGAGRADLKGSIAGPASAPQFDLTGNFKGLPLGSIIKLDGIKVRDYIDGSIAGTLAIGGSCNRRIKIASTVTLSEDDQILIRERWPILEALSITDTAQSYLRMAFSAGSFSFTTEGGGMKVEGIDVTSPKSGRLKGDFSTLLPTQEEAAKTLGIALTTDFSSDSTDSSSAQALEDGRMRIKNRQGEGSRALGMSIEDAVEEGIKKVKNGQLSPKALEGLRLRAEMKIHRVSGKLMFAIPSTAFEGNEHLAKVYPADQDGWRWIPMEMVDDNFTTIGEAAKQKLIEERDNRKTLEGGADQ